MNAKLLIPLLLVASTSANAVSSALAANSAGTSANIASAQCDMVQTSFDLKLSQNVGAGWTCSTTTAVVNTGSTKGASTFGGTTAGGTVAKCQGSTPSTTNGYSVAAPAIGGNGCS